MSNDLTTRYFRFPLVIVSTLLRTLADAAIRILPHPINKHEDTRKKLLIVRLDAIGDFIIFLDTFKEYRKLYSPSKWEITLFGNQVWCDLAKNLPYADRYWFLDRKRFNHNPFYRSKILRQVKQAGFDEVIQPTFSREYAFGDAIVRISGAAIKIGSVGNLSNITNWQKLRSDKWYTRLIPASDNPLIELERNAEFLRGLGLKEYKASAPVYPLESLPKQKLSIITAPYFVIFPGASWVEKQWSVKRYAEIANVLHKETGKIPVICGGPGEERVAEEVISCAPDLPWQNLSGKTSLDQMMRILNKARMLIGNDTSTVHLASSVGCPVVCIMGGGHFDRFFPYGDLEKNRIAYKKMDCFECNWRCIYPTVRCIEEITVDDVWKEVKHILKPGLEVGSGPNI